MLPEPAAGLHHELVRLVKTDAAPADPAAVATLLAQLKLHLASLGLLVPDSPTTTDEQSALVAAREILELGALFSVRTDDLPALDRYLALLAAAYYAPPLATQLPASTHRAPLTALALLRLLSQNRIADFHTLLETLECGQPSPSPGPSPDLLAAPEVAWVIQLERCLMEGSYSRVWLLCRPQTSASSSSSASLPLAEFAHLTPPLLATVRAEMAACHERAYESLPLRDARTLLFLDSDADVQLFAAQRNWYLDPSTQTLHFPSSPAHPSQRSHSAPHPAAAAGVPATMATGGVGPEAAAAATPADEARELDRGAVVRATLRYAKELESIV